jgi:integrase
MPKAKLTTKTTIEAIPYPPKGQVIWWDSTLRGFGVCVGVRTKTFVVQRDVKGASRRIAIGRYPEVSLQAARKAAEQLAGTMRGGTDPVEEQRKATADNMTLREAWALYENHLAAKQRSENTRAAYFENIDRYCADWWDRPLVEITPALAHERHVRIGTKRGKYAANLTMRALRAIWRRAHRQHRGLGEPPTVNVDFFAEQRRTAVIRVEDLPAWWRGLQDIRNPIRRDLFAFLLFTGTRRAEASSLRWEQVDLDAGTIHFPVTKTEPFTLPISTFLVGLLKSRRQCEPTPAVHGEDCPWVFPAKHTRLGYITEPGPHPNEMKLFPGEWTPHTLRHTFISIAENKVAMPTTHARLLTNHVLHNGGDAHVGYIHADLEDLRRSQQLMTDFLLAAIKPKTSGDVIPMRRRSS